ncbi:MAG: propanediol utilization protein [Deltaproteobacteria bacterium HGW-Deltaproteobacteria-14]|jgi:microcompartment protein CcmL/EutN|nr:MAG: propanediol utilization protein [Deltaproteobacteria bacterium HGW-Deltaproteobacteria-14]
MSWRSFGEPPPPSLALIELSSIARGIDTTDRMLKAAEVKLVMARTICSGKYMVMVAGELSEVEASVAAGLECSRECTIDHFIIPDVHPAVYPAVSATSVTMMRGALGVIESFSVAALIEAIDKVAKAALVEMVGCRLAMALGGKAYLTFTGDVDAVRYAMEAGVEVVAKRGLLVNQVVIPDPRPELFHTLM